MKVLSATVRLGLAAMVLVSFAPAVTAADTGKAPLTLADVAPTTANTPALRQKMAQLGMGYKSGLDFFEALRRQAGGGQALTWKNMPDWGGIYDRSTGSATNEFDQDGPPQGEMPLAKFTPAYKARLVKAVQDRKRGIEYDPLSQCYPPTYPRWFDMPFMRDFIVTPGQTTMIAEAFNSIRRIYTDGRGHMPPDAQFPTEAGDAIGFWVGDTLVVHTNQSMAHIYERAQGEYSDEVEGIEVWRKVDARTLVANLWIYDPPALLEPWYTRQRYTRLSNPDKLLRINNWYCKGNSNNEVYETKEGGSQHAEFTFMKGNGSTDKPK